jgi:hypothetical protein
MQLRELYQLHLKESSLYSYINCINNINSCARLKTSITHKDIEKKIVC